jgi:osmotically-inducible protein OsmY
VTRVRKLVGTVNWGRRAGDLLAAQVRAALDASVDSEAAAIAIRVQAGVVSLRGEVEDLRDISRLEAAVRAVPGVREVDNLLRLRLIGKSVRPTVLSA